MTLHGTGFANTILFESSLVRIGAFRCDRDYPGFRNTGPAAHDCFVFPRTAVVIEHEHEPRFAANPNVITFYNRGQSYQRHAVSKLGDRCDWFAVKREVVQEAVRVLFGTEVEQPFLWARGACDSETYLRQRLVFEGARTGKLTPLAVEEETIGILESVIWQNNAALLRADHRPFGVRRNHELIHRVESLLARTFDQAIHLKDIAIAVGSSPFNLCRLFRSQTGLTVHGYLKRLRVRHGLERVCEPRIQISRVAMDLGFAHHSHFTSSFREEFGETPGGIRRQIISSECHHRAERYGPSDNRGRRSTPK
jgi:AraC family transcriptional regulator